MKTTEYRRDLRDFVVSQGAQRVRWEEKSGHHPRLVFQYGEQQLSYLASSSPSDYRTILNDKALLRQQIANLPPPVEKPRERRSLDSITPNKPTAPPPLKMTSTGQSWF